MGTPDPPPLVLELTEALGHQPTQNEIAGHVADRISALEQNQRAVRCDGDAAAVAEIAQAMVIIRQEAAAAGVDRETHPGIFR